MSEPEHNDADSADRSVEAMERGFRQLAMASGGAAKINDERYMFRVDADRTAILVRIGSALSMIVEVEDPDFTGGKRPMRYMTAQRLAGGQALVHVLDMETQAADGIVASTEATDAQAAESVGLFLELCGRPEDATVLKTKL